MSDQKKSTNPKDLSNLELFKLILEFYEKNPSLDIKDNKYTLYFIKSSGFSKSDLTPDFIKHVAKFIMLIRVSILEEGNVYDTIISQL